MTSREGELYRIQLSPRRFMQTGPVYLYTTPVFLPP